MNYKTIPLLVHKQRRQFLISFREEQCSYANKQVNDLRFIKRATNSYLFSEFWIEIKDGGRSDPPITWKREDIYQKTANKTCILSGIGTIRMIHPVVWKLLH